MTVDDGGEGTTVILTASPMSNTSNHKPTIQYMYMYRDHGSKQLLSVLAYGSVRTHMLECGAVFECEMCFDTNPHPKHGLSNCGIGY
jgi:hypothetical protein